ncbi:MAG: ribonuclease P [Thaumarchaeota archaeon]|nr:ribonuclease P [Nitrososphaerota archaeon]
MPAFKRKEAKMHAFNASRNLLKLSVSTAMVDPALAKRQADLARRLMLKYNIRFGWELKRFYCHGCKHLMVPGVNATVRVSGGKVITTCTDCGHVNRKTVSDRQIRPQNPS